MPTSTKLSEEAAGLMRRIVERQGYRQLLLAHIRGSGLRYVPDLDTKISMTVDLGHGLRVLREIERIYKDLGGQDLLLVCRDSAERVSSPTSKAELAAALVLCDHAERLAAESYIDSAVPDLAAVARSMLTSSSKTAEEASKYFVDFAREAGNRPQAEQHLRRWLGVAVRALGRPGTAGDRRATELKLRSRSSAQSLGLLFERIEPWLQATGLETPSAEAMGVELTDSTGNEDQRSHS